jgi:hypothetical protein
MGCVCVKLLVIVKNSNMEDLEQQLIKATKQEVVLKSL